MTLDEYSLAPKPSSSESGDVTFTARNSGTIPHQLLVLRTQRRAERLPTSKGVVTLAGDIERVGEIPAIEEGDAEPLSLSLTPGSYVLICNIVSHYENGMRAPFSVR